LNPRCWPLRSRLRSTEVSLRSGSPYGGVCFRGATPLVDCTEMAHPAPDRDLAMSYLHGSQDTAPLFAHAAALRDDGRGRTVTFSPKVFIPLTTLCRDTCTYCTFVKPPGAGGQYLTPDDVLAIARAGDQHGCTEALLTLGEQPEVRVVPQRSSMSRR
jgi:2-iminoacetate synthase ThiH